MKGKYNLKKLFCGKKEDCPNFALLGWIFGIACILTGIWIAGAMLLYVMPLINGLGDEDVWAMTKLPNMPGILKFIVALILSPILVFGAFPVFGSFLTLGLDCLDDGLLWGIREWIHGLYKTWGKFLPWPLAKKLLDIKTKYDEADEKAAEERANMEYHVPAKIYSYCIGKITLRGPAGIGIVTSWLSRRMKYAYALEDTTFDNAIIYLLLLLLDKINGMNAASYEVYTNSEKLVRIINENSAEGEDLCKYMDTLNEIKSTKSVTAYLITETDMRNTSVRECFDMAYEKVDRRP